MSKYTFTFKKDDIFVEFITEDRDVVERQFQIWVADADEYAKSGGSKSLKGKTINAINSQASEPEVKEEVKEEKAEESERKNPVVQISEEIKEPEVVKQEINEPEVINTSQNEVSEPEVLAQEEPVFDKASSLLKTINSIQGEQQIFEQNEDENAKTDSGVDFGTVFDKTLENPTFEPTKASDQVFLNLVNSKHTTDKFHYLIITAYYLSEFEKFERFSLKQINSKLMQNLSEVIDHSMLQEAINQGFIELIPDLTGIAEVGEYRLTRAGEEFFANKIG